MEDSPNEAYEVVPSDWPAGWWTVTCNGIPVRHYAPESKHLAERYCTDPEYRVSLATEKLWVKAVK